MIVIADEIVPLVELQDENVYEYCAVDVVAYDGGYSDDGRGIECGIGERKSRNRYIIEMKKSREVCSEEGVASQLFFCGIRLPKGRWRRRIFERG